MFDIDFIVPCYGRSEIIEKGINSIATQWQKQYIHVTLVNDCSPNTDCNYQDLVDKYSNLIDIRCIKTPKNVGQGLARQYGIDHTSRDFFMFMDEDDMLASVLTISIFCGAYESNMYKIKDGSNEYELDDQNNFIRREDAKEIALISGPLFEFDLNYNRIIPADNIIWLNSKLFNRKFIEKYNIKFNEAQSRHAEDYYFMSCFYFSLDHHLDDYNAIMLDDNSILYAWYPNKESQGRIDPHYPYMLSGYTMNGSINILKYMKETNKNHLIWNDELEKEYKYRLLNISMYSFFNFITFIGHIANSDYIPKLELDWIILRDSMNEIRSLVYKYINEYTETEIIEEFYRSKNMSDIIFTEPWISYKEFIINGAEELKWNFNELMKCKENNKYKKKEGD